ncbi:MAG: NAD(P)-dependent oxidoreductase [Leptospiraceae bacterium]|nr:NAD(P)-dependent oxidoreductase [Leptospiraceae bacterium]
MRIAFLGTGLLGLPMAGRLLEENFELNVYNRTQSKTATLAAAGARIFAEPARACADADVIILMLADRAAIDAVLFTGNPPCPLAGRSVIQMGTISPEESRDLSIRVAEAGGHYLEAPVLGSIPQAIHRQLMVLAGGDRSLFDNLLSVLRAFDPEPRYIGPVGQAAALKLALNQLIATLTTAFTFSLALVQKSDVSVDQFMDIVRQSALYAPTFDKKLEAYLNRSFDNPNFPLKHLLKDTRLMEAAGANAGLQTEHLQGIIHLLEKGMAAGHGDLDYSALYLAMSGSDAADDKR